MKKPALITLIPKPDKDITKNENYLELLFKSCHGDVRTEEQGCQRKCLRHPEVGTVLVLQGSPPGCPAISPFAAWLSFESEGGGLAGAGCTQLSLGFFCRLVFFTILMIQTWRES